MREFSRLLRNGPDDQDCVEAVTREPAGPVVRDELAGNRFLLFDDRVELCAWMHEGPPRCAHEVVFGGQPQRLKFDLEGTDRDLPAADGRLLLDGVVRQLLDTMWELYPELQLGDADVLRLDSSGPTLDGWKHSYHVVVPDCALTTAQEARFVAGLVADGLPPSLKRMVDLGVYKRVQMFRLSGALRMGTRRVLRPAGPTRPWDDYLVTAPSGCRVLPAPPGFLPTAPRAEEAESGWRTQAEGLRMPGHRLRVVRGCFAFFDREVPTYCNLCAETHHRDNTVMLRRDPRGVVELCRHAPGKQLPFWTDAVQAPPPHDAAPVPTGAPPGRSTLESHIAATLVGERSVHEPCVLDAQGSYSEPAMRQYEPVPTLCVRAQMKMGKTKRLREYVDRHFAPGGLSPPVVRFVTFRQTFAAAMTGKFPDFVLYSDSVGDLDSIRHPRLIVQVESLHRLRIVPGEDPVDLLIVDECESVLGQFSSGLHRSFHASFAAFRWMVSTARHVVCLDANLGDRTARTLGRLRPSAPALLHWNQHPRAADQSYEFTLDFGAWLASLSAALDRGERVVVPSSSLADVRALEGYLGRHHPALRVGVYTGDTPAATKAQHFADVDRYWAQLDVLVYTPTCTAGVSFEVAGHFAALYGLFSDRSCDVETCRQMMERVRDLRTGRHVVCLRAAPVYAPTSLEDIRRQVYAQRGALYRQVGECLEFEYDAQGFARLYEGESFNLWLETQRITNLSRRYFVTRFVNQVMSTGARVAVLARIEGVDYGALLAEFKGAKEVAKQDRAQAVAQADELEAEEAAQVRTAMAAGKDVAPALRLALERHDLRALYGLQVVTANTVLQYGRPEVRHAYRNWVRLVRNGNSVAEALDCLRDHETGQYASLAGAREAQVWEYGRSPYWRAAAACRLLEGAGFRLDRWERRTETDIQTALSAAQWIGPQLPNICAEFAVPMKFMRAARAADEDGLVALLQLIGHVLKVQYGMTLRVATRTPRVWSFEPGLIKGLFEFRYDPAGQDREPSDRPLIMCSFYIGCE